MTATGRVARSCDVTRSSTTSRFAGEFSGNFETRQASFAASMYAVVAFSEYGDDVNSVRILRQRCAWTDDGRGWSKGSKTPACRNRRLARVTGILRAKRSASDASAAAATSDRLLASVGALLSSSDDPSFAGEVGSAQLIEVQTACCDQRAHPRPREGSRCAPHVCASIQSSTSARGRNKEKLEARANTFHRISQNLLRSIRRALRRRDARRCRSMN